MNRKVILSNTAEKKLNKLFDYLIEKWSVKVKNEFIEKLDLSINVIKNQPEIFPESKVKKGLRKCVVTNKTTIYYRFTSKQISIITLFDTRQHPQKLNKEFKNER
ncbi:type II toxin-antitoxin system RelE/ParE family toxin [Myroides guanonis]|uniref:Plasmid stabilization system protein ParE n=1 Tax=Myroides guanonis TaxID=1150112 RepID=A0A1I3L4V7_9FLAO|nr:type II toxin-antitoxin system RelE/ParE family toxin [Myroides guanonis]SFI79711.1 Plasmid stabilization system protein ParE [Myroides guanonis]